MGKIAWGRVILGGVVAGILWFIFEGVVQGYLLGQEWHTAMAALGRSEEEMKAGAGHFMLLVSAWCFLAGIAGVWLYAAIRPRFGPGPQTAVTAGIGLWAMIYFAPSIFDFALHLWPSKLILIPMFTSFFESIIATLVGAWLYKEA